MESEEQWSHRDFTQIKPRRPEGTECEDWEEGTFSFLWPTASGAGVEEEGGGAPERSGHGCDEDGNEKDEGEGLQEEFEFSNIISTATSSAVVERLSPSGISPADELFFKGQLLPLHLPPRIQMVKKLVLERQQQREYREQEAQEQPQYEPPAAALSAPSSDMRASHRKVDNMGTHMGHVNAAMSALSQARFGRLFQPKYSKFCNLSSAEVVSPASARLGNSWWDPRDSPHAHVHEYSSAGSFTSTDRDSSGDSSSSRDSNGSSQDCFDSSSSSTSKDQFLTTTDSKGFFHNREVFSTHSAHPERNSSGISTWLRPPFKWKVLFGAKKPWLPSPKPSSPFDTPEVHTRALSMEAAGLSEMAFSTSPVSTDRYYSDCSGELTYSGDLLLSSRTFIHGSDMEKYPRGIERARGYLQKYMKALNPNRSKDHHHGSSTDDSGAVTTTTTTNRTNSPAITTSKMFPPFSQSFRFSPKDIPLRMKRPPPSSPSPSPLPGPRRVSTSSASSELHCDIKGAIAHCKESQRQESQPKHDDEPLDPICVNDQNVPKVASDEIVKVVMKC